MGCVWSSIPVAIFKVMQQPQLYRMYAIQRQLNQDHINSYNNLWNKKKKEKKKDNKKASSNILVQTSIKDK